MAEAITKPSRWRRVTRYYRHLANDPEVRQAAKSLAVLGVMGVGLWKAPNLRYKAITKWRSLSKRRTPLRHALQGFAYGSRATRKAHIMQVVSASKTARLQKRAAHLSKVSGVKVTEQELRDRLAQLSPVSSAGVRQHYWFPKKWTFPVSPKVRNRLIRGAKARGQRIPRSLEGRPRRRKSK